MVYREQRAKGGISRSPIGGHNRIVRGGRSRGGLDSRGRKRPGRYDDVGSGPASREKFGRYDERRDMRVIFLYYYGKLWNINLPFL